MTRGSKRQFVEGIVSQLAGCIVQAIVPGTWVPYVSALKTWHGNAGQVETQKFLDKHVKPGLHQPTNQQPLQQWYKCMRIETIKFANTRMDAAFGQPRLVKASDLTNKLR